MDSAVDFEPTPSPRATNDPRPLTLEIDGRVVVVPTVTPDGRIMSDYEALRQYMVTRRALGSFANRQEAERAAGVLAGLIGQR